MIQFLKIVCGMSAVIILLSACAALSDPVADQRAVEIAWQDLEPLASSRQRANWDVKEVRQVKGSEISKQYGGVNPFYCVAARRAGKFPENEKIDANKMYWQVHFVPKPATPLPRTRVSPTEPPLIPEPHLRDVYYLLDPDGFRIVARAYSCVVT